MLKKVLVGHADKCQTISKYIFEFLNDQEPIIIAVGNVDRQTSGEKDFTLEKQNVLLKIEY